jgi:hypothetical protein
LSSAAPKLSQDDEELPLSVDPVGDWIRAHLDEVQRHKGRHIAIDPARGIIASGSYDEVTRALEAANVSPESDVAIFPVR